MDKLPKAIRYCDYDAIVHYPAGSFGKQWKTILSGKIRELPTEEPLPDWLASSFADGAYKFCETLEDLILYRVFGRILSLNSKEAQKHGAEAQGAFASTEFAESIIDAKLRLALAPEWKNTKMYEAKIRLPKGQKIYVGTVAKVILKSKTVLPGGADQILLPKNWPESWIIGYRRITARQLQQVPIYALPKPPEFDVKPNAYDSIPNTLYRSVCPYCGSENISRLLENEQFQIMGCKGGIYTMKNVCNEEYCHYYW